MLQTAVNLSHCIPPGVVRNHLKYIGKVLSEGF